MPNRVELDIQGTSYTFPVNPLEYESQDDIQYTLRSTIDGGAVRFTPFFDDRPRIMRWRNIPNKTPYTTMIPTLRSAVGISGVRLNHRDLDINGDQNVWRDIVVQNVKFSYVPGAGPASATSNLRFDLELTFTYSTNQT